MGHGGDDAQELRAGAHAVRPGGRDRLELHDRLDRGRGGRHLVRGLGRGRARRKTAPAARPARPQDARDPELPRPRAASRPGSPGPLSGRVSDCSRPREPRTIFDSFLLAFPGGPMKSLDSLKARLAEIEDLNYSAAVLRWDQTTYMPPGGA